MAGVGSVGAMGTHALHTRVRVHLPHRYRALPHVPHLHLPVRVLPKPELSVLAKLRKPESRPRPRPVLPMLPVRVLPVWAVVPEPEPPWWHLLRLRLLLVLLLRLMLLLLLLLLCLLLSLQLRLNPPSINPGRPNQLTRKKNLTCTTIIFCIFCMIPRPSKFGTFFSTYCING